MPITPRRFLPRVQMFVCIAACTGLAAADIVIPGMPKPTETAPAETEQTPGTKAILPIDAIQDLPENFIAQNRYALIIGGSDYSNGISDLPACRNDAIGLYNVLTDPERGQFPTENVTLLIDSNVSEANISAALGNLARKAGEDDLVIIFYSGHGAKDDRGVGYWVMPNTDPRNLAATAMSAERISRLVEDIRSNRLVTLIDACYSEATAGLGRKDIAVDIKELLPKFRGEGRVTITSSTGEQLSIVIPEERGPENGGGYSAFAWHLIQGFGGAADGSGIEDGVVTLDELWDYVRDRTQESAADAGGNQDPTLSGRQTSRFALAIEPSAIVANASVRAGRIAKLKELHVAQRLTDEQFSQAASAITPGRRPHTITREHVAVWERLADGVISPSELRSELLLAESKASSRGWSAPDWITDAAATTTNRSMASSGFEGPRGIGFVTGPAGIRLRVLSGGTFVQGSPQTEDGRRDDEGQRLVEITTPFAIGLTEVSVAQWNTVMGERVTGGVAGKRPISNISFEQISEFLDRLNTMSINDGSERFYRLPTEAEWEFACRAGDPSPDAIRPATGSLRSVDATPANTLGLMGMLGNVAEWVQDTYGPYDSVGGRVSDPMIMGASTANRVAKGGSYRGPDDTLRPAARWSIPNRPSSLIGFRVVAESPEFENR